MSCGLLDAIRGAGLKCRDVWLGLLVPACDVACACRRQDSNVAAVWGHVVSELSGWSGNGGCWCTRAAARCLRGGFALALWYAGSCAALAALAMSARAADVLTGEVEKLISQLGDSRYRVRQRASMRLAEIGSAARGPLEQALASPDPEVRQRARQVLAHILDLDFEARLAAFSADTEGRLQHDLPCWERYRALAGGEGSSRRLFVEMLRAERWLLEAAESSATDASEYLEARCRQWQHAMQHIDPTQRRPPSAGSVLAMLLVGADEDVPISGEAATTIAGFTYQRELQEAMRDADQAAVVHRLLGAWVGRPFEADSTVTYQNIVLALRYNLAEGVPAALGVMAAPASPPHIRQYGILCVAKLGGASYIDQLEALLDDPSPCASFRLNDQEIETQIRDVALAVLVRLTGQDLRAYGFDRAQENALTYFNTATLGFADEDARKAALERYREYARQTRRTP